MTHIHTTPTFALRQLARCIWRVTIDTLDIEGVMLDARKVAEDRHFKRNGNHLN